jgi:hypothetical protein
VPTRAFNFPRTDTRALGLTPAHWRRRPRLGADTHALAFALPLTLPLLLQLLVPLPLLLVLLLPLAQILPLQLPLLLWLRGLVLRPIPTGFPSGKGQALHKLPLLLSCRAGAFVGDLASQSALVARHLGKKIITRDMAPRKAPGEGRGCACHRISG